MSVTFDASATGGGYPQIPQSFSHSLGVGSGNDRVVLVFVESIGPSPHTFVTATYDGVAMTQLTQITASIFGRITAITVFYLLDANLPASSGSYTFAWEIDSGAYDSKVAVLSYSGVDQDAAPFDFSTSSDSNNPALSGSYSTNHTVVASNGLLVDGFGGEPVTTGSSGTPGGSQTERVDFTDVDEMLFVSEKAFTSSGSNSMSWTPSVDYYTASHAIVELPEPAAEEEAMMFGANF